MTAIGQKRMPDFCSRRRPFHYSTALNVLTKMGIDINRLNILAVGKYANYRGEIQYQEPAADTLIEDDTTIVLKVGFSSAVDYMPYQFFYGMAGITSRTGDWDNRARELMAPYDASVIRYNSLAVYQMLEFSFGLVELDHLVRFLKLFGFSLHEKTPRVSEALFWATILPTFHFWAGNADFVAKVLHRLFGYDFRIVENVEAEHKIPDSLHSRLGSKSNRLGEELVLGESFRECDSSYELQVRAVRPEEIRELLPGKPVREKLEWLLSICMPNNLDCKTRMFVDRHEFVLGGKERKNHLGYSTFV